MNTSMGYHTLYPYRKLTAQERSSLYDDFDRFRAETGEIKIYEREYKLPPGASKFEKSLFENLPKYYRFSYLRNDKGLRWDMRKRNFSPGFIRKPPGYRDRPFELDVDTPCSIKAKINPKDLAGVGGLAAATVDDLRNVEDIFNGEAARISPLLGRLDEYAYSRIDYCLNVDFREVYVGCSPEQMMELIEQADIAHFKVWGKYDKVAKRMKPAKHSFRLTCNSVKINCYNKGNQLETQYPDNPYLEAAGSVIRFEAQCYYPKVYAMSRDARDKKGCSHSELLYELLSYEKCAEIIRHYFHKTIGKGNYYTLDGAISMVHLQKMRDKTKQQLIDTLKLVNGSRGSPKARSKLQGDELETFNHSLWELNNMGINPVTIPKREKIQWMINQWGVNYIPNLLNAYYDELSNGNTPLTREMKSQLARYQMEKAAQELSYEKL